MVDDCTAFNKEKSLTSNRASKSQVWYKLKLNRVFSTLQTTKATFDITFRLN